MKKKLLIIAAVSFAIINLAFVIPVVAQHVYLGMYWIAGSLSAPAGVTTEGRRVVFYQADPNLGYAEAISGPSGLSGRDNEYMLNAFQDWRMAILPGTYHIATVKGADGYGANPIEIEVTGRGYDLAALLNIVEGGGIDPPLERPEMAAGMAPRFSNVRFGSRKYQRTLVERGEPFIISDRPRISAQVLSDFGVNVASLSMILNQGDVDSREYSIKAANITAAAGPDDSPTDVSFVYDVQAEGVDALPEGEQLLTLRASNAFGATSESFTVTVLAGDTRLIGVPIAFPSPLHLRTDNEVTFQYTLSSDSGIVIAVFDISGRIVKKMVLAEREDGGSAGVNKITWNLVTDQGSRLGAGIYVFTIATTDNKLLGKGKFTTLP